MDGRKEGRNNAICSNMDGPREYHIKRSKSERERQGFPGGTVVKNPLANAGDTGSSPGPGRSHMLLSNLARALQLLSPCATTTEPARLESMLCNKRSHHNEACALQQRVAPACHN